MNEGIRLCKKRKFDQALRVFLAYEAKEVEEGILSYYIGLCYTHLRQYDEALLYLEQVVSSDVGFLHMYQARMIIGYVYAITKRYRLAEFEFNRLLEDGYESAKVYAALAYVMYAQGKTAPAIANLEKALRIDAGNANALNSLAYILAQNNIQLSVAEQHCRRALKERPDYPAYLDTMALIQTRYGNAQAARELYERAIRLSRGNSEIVEHFKSFIADAAKGKSRG